MILVTGAYGFIGSNLVHELNRRGYNNLILVDDLTQGSKYKNLLGAEFNHYYDADTFFSDFNSWHLVRTIYHQGAVSSTTEINGKLVMNRNYNFSCALFYHAQHYHIPISYASSASVYGNKTDGSLDPLNLYAYSKMLVDQQVIKNINKFNLVHGWRYFNVYGDRESHKGDQASPITKFTKQIKETGSLKLFEGSDKIYRDFIAVDDIVQIIVDSVGNRLGSGIRDLGTGLPISFETVARQVTRKYGGEIEYIPFPDKLKQGYQYLTQAKSNVKYKYTKIIDWLDNH